MAFSQFTLHVIHFLTNPFLSFNFNGLKDKQKMLWGEIVNIFLPHSQNLFWVLKRMTQQDHSFRYPEHMFWLRNRKILRFDCLDSKKKYFYASAKTTVLCIQQNPLYETLILSAHNSWEMKKKYSKIAPTCWEPTLQCLLRLAKKLIK